MLTTGIEILRLQFFALALVCWLIPCASGQSSSGSTTLALVVAPQCSITIVSQSAQVLTFLYKIRTATQAGQGQITLHFSDSKNVPESSTLDYQTQTSGPGSAVSGSTPISTALTSGIVIARFGAHASSTRSGATGTVQYTVNSSLPVQLQPSLAISCQ